MQFIGSSEDFVQGYRTALLSSPGDHLARFALSLALLRSGEYSEAAEQASMVLPSEGSTNLSARLIDKDISFGEVRSATVRLIEHLKSEMQSSSDGAAIGAMLEQFNLILLGLEDGLYGN